MGVRDVLAKFRVNNRRMNGTSADHPFKKPSLAASGDETVKTTTPRQGSTGSLFAIEEAEQQQQQKVPRKPLPSTSFLKLCQQQRFHEMLEVLELEDEFDLDGWLFLDSNNSKNNNNNNSHNSSQLRGGKRLVLPSWVVPRRTKNNNHQLHLFRGESPLHVAVQYSPTEQVVDRLIEYVTRKTNTVPEDAVDITGKTPLHVAATTGCSYTVVARLLNGVSAVMPAVAKDSMGRHALHWACTNPHGVVSSTTTTTTSSSSSRRMTATRGETAAIAGDIDNSYQVIRLLIKTYPEALCLKDVDGNTPLDLALLNGADQRIVNLLENAGEDGYSSSSSRNLMNGNKNPKKTPIISNKKNKRNGLNDDDEQQQQDDDESINFQDQETVFPNEIQPQILQADDVSSIGFCGVSNAKTKKADFRKKAKEMADTPWKHMTTIEQVMQYVEQQTAASQQTPQQQHQQQQSVVTKTTKSGDNKTNNNNKVRPSAIPQLTTVSDMPIMIRPPQRRESISNNKRTSKMHQPLFQPDSSLFLFQDFANFATEFVMEEEEHDPVQFHQSENEIQFTYDADNDHLHHHALAFANETTTQGELSLFQNFDH